MIRPIKVEALSRYRLYLEFSDGTKGEVDLSSRVEGVFRDLKDPGFFAKVRIGEHREIRWDDDIELCADSLYLSLTGKLPDQLASRLEALNELRRSIHLTPAQADDWQKTVKDARR